MYNGHMRYITAAGLARLMGVTPSYVQRLCRLPETHKKHIKNIKIHSSTYLITDEVILSKYPEKKLEEVAVPDFLSEK